MRITIDIETDHPDAYDHLRTDLAGLVTGLADDGKPGATWVRIREAVYEGMATRREWIGERDAMPPGIVPCAECEAPIAFGSEWLHVDSGKTSCVGFDTVAAPN
jgi:hypothetical protein